MRVTGGAARGRALKMPGDGVVRPTSDKMRQALYNLLSHSPFILEQGFDLDGAQVLDGFCGTGALGIEALSRGAAACVFVDYDAKVLQTTRENAKACGFAGQAGFLTKGCQNMGARPASIQPANLVLLDPPYNKDLAAPALTALHEGGWCADGAICVCETELRAIIPAPAVFKPLLMRDYGQSQLNIWVYRP